MRWNIGIEKIVKKKLLKGTKGIQVWFEKEGSGSSWLRTENYRLAWSPERPEVRENLEDIIQTKDLSLLKDELDHLNVHLDELRSEAKKLQKEVSKKAWATGLRVSFRKLNSKHVNVSYQSGDSYTDLQRKCEETRKDLTRYQDEKIVLSELKHQIGYVKERKEVHPEYFKYSLKDHIAYFTIRGIRKTDLKEEKIRGVLRDLGFPEDHVVTFKGYGPHLIELEPDGRKRRRLHRKRKERKIQSKYYSAAKRAARSIDKNYDVWIYFDGVKPRNLKIGYYKSIYQSNDEEVEPIIERLEKLGFDIDREYDDIDAKKIIDLKGDETTKEIEAIVKEALAGKGVKD